VAGESVAASTVFTRVLRSLRDDRDELVIVDSPCGAGPDATRPLDVADAVILVTRPTPSAVRDTVKTCAMARALGTPVVACAVVGELPDRPLAGHFGLERVVRIPVVDGDPLRADAVNHAAVTLATACTARQTPF
jgi:septum site-determining protein MinD